MADTVERLAVLIEAQTKSYENAMKRIEQRTTRALNAASRSSVGLDQNLKRLSATTLNYFALFAGGLGIASITRFIDANQKIGNSLRVAGLEGTALTSTYEKLFKIANENAAPFETLAALYSKASIAQSELKATSEDLIRFTELVAQSLRVSGRSAEESRGAIIQLSQAIGSGIVRAEEFNAILEGALPIAQAAAAGLDEAGGSVARLRKLIIDGKVSSEAFFRAFQAGAPIIEDKLVTAELTISQRLTRLQNVLIATSGRLGEATGVTGGLSESIDALSGVLEDLANSPILQFLGKLADGFNAVRAAATHFREQLGIEQFFEGTSLIKGTFGAADPATEMLQARAGATERLRDALVGISTVSAGAGSTTSRFANAFGAGVTPVSLEDFPLGSSDRDTRQIKKVNRVIEALKLQEAQLGRTDREQAIYNELARAGVTLNSEAGGAIAALVGKVYDQQRALAEADAQARFFSETLYTAFTDILLRGEDAVDVVKKLALALAEAALQAALLGSGPLAGLFGTSPSRSGAVGGLLGSIFGGGRAAGGPIAAGRAYMVGERGPEMIVSRSAGSVVPMNRMGSGQTIVKIVPSDYFDAVVDGRAAAVARPIAQETSQRTYQTGRKTEGRVQRLSQ